MGNFDRNKQSFSASRNSRGGRFSGSRGGFGGDRYRPMMHQAVCDNCGKDCEVPFRPTSGKPVFCSSCFEKNGSASSGRFEERSSADRPMFDAVCDNCKKDCKVPFQPRGDKPIYCSNCFENKNESGSRSSEQFQSQPKSQYKEQFEALNIKLDKILGMLTPVEKQAVEQSDDIKSEKKVKAKVSRKTTPTKKE